MALGATKGATQLFLTLSLAVHLLKRTKSNTIVLTGLSGSGKTVLFYLLPQIDLPLLISDCISRTSSCQMIAFQTVVMKEEEEGVVLDKMESTTSRESFNKRKAEDVTDDKCKDNRIKGEVEGESGIRTHGWNELFSLATIIKLLTLQGSLHVTGTVSTVHENIVGKDAKSYTCCYEMIVVLTLPNLSADVSISYRVHNYTMKKKRYNKSHPSNVKDFASEPLVGRETVFYGSRNGVVTEVAPAEGMALLHIHGDKCMLHEARNVFKGIK
ncbi:hypothetical protein REPUB_Repub11eG0101600 [Reevesia pubescens]